MPNFRNATITHKKLGSFLGAERVFDAPRQTSIPDPLRSDVAEAREAVLGIKSLPTTPAGHRKSIVSKANSEIATPSSSGLNGISQARSAPKAVTPLMLPRDDAVIGRNTGTQNTKMEDGSFSSSRDEYSIVSDSLSDEESGEAKQRSQSFSAYDSSSGEGPVIRKKDLLLDREASRDVSPSVSESSALTERSSSTDTGLIAVSEEEAAKEEKLKKKKKKKSPSFLSPQTDRKKKHKHSETVEEVSSPKKKEKEKEKKKKKSHALGSTSSTDMPSTPETPKRHKERGHSPMPSNSSESHSQSSSHHHHHHDGEKKHRDKRKKASSFVLDAGSRANSEIDGAQVAAANSAAQSSTSPRRLASTGGAGSSLPANASLSSVASTATAQHHLPLLSTSTITSTSSTSSPLNSARGTAAEGYEGIHLTNRSRSVLRKDSSLLSSSGSTSAAPADDNLASPASDSSSAAHIGLQLHGQSQTGPSTPKNKQGPYTNTHTGSNSSSHLSSSGGHYQQQQQRSPPTSIVITARSNKAGSPESPQLVGSPQNGLDLGDLSDLKEMLDEIHLPSDHIAARKGRALSRDEAVFLSSSSSRGNLAGGSPSRLRNPRTISSSSSSTGSLPIPHAISTFDVRGDRDSFSNSPSPINTSSAPLLDPASSPAGPLSRSVDAVSPSRSGGLKNGLGTIYGGAGDSLSSDDNPLSYIEEDGGTPDDEAEDEYSDAIANLRLSEDDIYSTMKRGSRLLMNTRNRSNSLLLQDLFATPSVHSRAKIPVTFDLNSPDPVRPDSARGRGHHHQRQGSGNNDSVVAADAAEATRAANKQLISRSPPPSMSRVPYAEMRSGSFSIDTSSRKAVTRERMAQGASLDGDEESEFNTLPEELRIHASRLPIGVRGSMRNNMAPLMKQCRGFWVEVGREHLSPSVVLGDPASFAIDDAADDKLWYAEYFASHPHFNYIGVANYISGSSSPSSSSSSSSSANQEQFVLSVIRPQSANVMRVLLRTKRGDERQVISETKDTAKIFKSTQVKSKIPASDLMRLIAPSLTNVKLRVIKDLNLIYDLMSFEERLRTKTYKFGILLCKEGQTKEEEMFSNEYGSEHYDSFLNMLGDTIELKGWEKFRGGLDTTDRQSTGEKSLYSQYEGNEVMFHVSTMLPFSTDNPQQLERKRHLGNDIVVLVFKEGNTPFLPNTISSEFIHVIAVVQPEIQNEKVKYRFSIASKDGVPPFSPSLPATGLFEPGVAFRNLILTKLINGERAAYKAPAFSGKFQRTRQIMLKELDAKFK